jgi:predicted transcriptional regulator
MKVLLSIKPEFANEILNGSKKYEFRRMIFKNPDITEVLIYSSSPVQKVVGEFKIDFIINKDLKELWADTKEHAGITEEYFFEYFEGKSKGYAIKVQDVIEYKKPLKLKEKFGLNPPQSFAYVG